MTDIFDSGKHGAIVAIPFAFSNATTGMTNSDFVLPGTGTLHVMPKGGSVIGIGVRSNVAITAGTVIVKAHKAGTEYTDVGAPAPVLSSDNQESYGSVRPGVMSFDTGDTLGLSLTTTTTLDPTDSADVDGLLYVQLDPN